MPRSEATKKQRILGIAREMGGERFSPFEVEQIRRQMIAHYGDEGKTSPDYIAGVLQTAGLNILWATREDAVMLHEEEFEDLLHFSTLEEAEMTIIRLDEMWRKFTATEERATAERVLVVARLGKRRAEMISRNKKVDAAKRAEKSEMVEWFRRWLDTPTLFFDWLEMRKKSPEYVRKFGRRDAAAL